MHTGGSRAAGHPAFPRAMAVQFIVRGKKERLKVSIPPRIIASSFRLKKARLPAGTQRVHGFKVENPYAKTTVFHCRRHPRNFRLALRVRAIGATRERFTALTNLAQHCPRPSHPEPRFVTIRESPPSWPGWIINAAKPKFGKEEYFFGRGLTHFQVVCPSDHLAGHSPRQHVLEELTPSHMWTAPIGKRFLTF